MATGLMRGALVSSSLLVFVHCGGGDTSTAEAVPAATGALELEGAGAGTAHPLVELATVPNVNPTGLATDGVNVYWAIVGSQISPVTASGIYSVPVGGGTPVTLWTDPTARVYPSTISVDATHLYFSTTSLSQTQALYRMPKGGGSPLEIAPLAGQTSIATDGVNVYTADTGAVYSVPIGGGSVVTLDSTGSPEHVAVRGSSVFASGPFGWDELLEMPVGGGSVSTLASGLAACNGWAVTTDASYVYWTAGQKNDSGAIVRAPLGGGAATTLVSGFPHEPITVAVDATSLYFTAYTGGLYRAPIGGGAYVALNKTAAIGYYLALDAHHVYLVNAQGVYRVKK